MYRKTSLWLLLNDKNQIMLFMKKRGFWEGKLNWPWWKPEWDETIEQTAIRETFEETGLDISKNIKGVWILHFEFIDKPEWNQTVCLFLSQNIKEAPVETEEMKPYFFDLDKIPYDKMWEDDILWIPRILAWEEDIEYKFEFNKDWKMLNYKIVK